MDPNLEKGDLTTSTTKKSGGKTAACSSVCLLFSLLMLTLVLSLSALALGAVNYWEGAKRQSGLEEISELKVIIEDPDLEEQALRQLEDIFGEEEDMHSAPYDVEKRQAQDGADPRTGSPICNSTDLEHKPLAHIVPQNAGTMRTHTQGLQGSSYSVLTEDWKCRPDARNPSGYGRVHGGMIFNKTSGFLRLPEDGVYFVYSQVNFRISNINQPFSIKHQTVACVPHHGCTSPDTGSTQTYIETVDRYLGNTRLDAESSYHGGLLHFPAGTQIALVTYKPLRVIAGSEGSTSDISVDGTWHRTFMGAFLVERIPFS